LLLNNGAGPDIANKNGISAVKHAMVLGMNTDYPEKI
jgi:hypothetical protein